MVVQPQRQRIWIPACAGMTTFQRDGRSATMIIPRVARALKVDRS